MSEPISFLNADLDISSTSDLTPLRDHFMTMGDLFFEMCCEKTSVGYFARFEIHPTCNPVDPTAVELIEAYCDVVESLSGEMREIWGNSDTRVIDLGYQGSDHCAALNDKIPSSLLSRVASAGIDLALTIYPPTIKN